MITNDDDEELLAAIINVDGFGYEGFHSKSENLKLKIRVYDYKNGKPLRKQAMSVETFKSIKDAKLWANKFFSSHEAWLPAKEIES